MQAQNKIRIAAALAAVSVTAALCALAGPAGSAVESGARRSFEALSPAGQARAAALARFLAVGAPAVAAALVATLAAWRRRRDAREEAAAEPAKVRFGEFE